MQVQHWRWSSIFLLITIEDYNAPVDRKVSFNAYTHDNKHSSKSN